ncbi:leucine ABC transporter subunit substrate-binding protein LivK [Escherichia coli SHECO001]|nr:branched-chain amino acid ABC transporter substrate-binding protein [Escherichia coli]OSK02161.1 leucine ABC transporter subunit substrate-binding protein LivK [Escherichia coli SHECO001]
MNIKGKALLAGCIALAFSNMALAEDIKVAVVGAMSGPVAQYGDQEFTGAEQAVADINAKGGIKGNKLQIVKYDDACDPKQAVAVANKVVNDGIKYVIGHLCSSSTQPASDIYEDEGILMITPAATAPELTARGYQLILRTTGLDSDQGPTAAKYILEKVKPQRIAIVHDKQQYGEGLARAVQDGLKKGNANVVFFDGITAGEKDFSTLVARLKKENIDFVYYGGFFFNVVFFDGITAGEKDFSTLVARLKKENIDFVYYGGYHPEMGQILRQARAAGLKTQFMGPEGVANVSLSNIAGESAEGLLVTKPKNYDQVPANKPIVDAIKAKKQDPSGAFVWTTYAALQSLQAGLNQSDDPAEIAKYLKANSVDTVMGPLTWDEKGDLKGFEFGVFDWHANGTATDAK